MEMETEGVQYNQHTGGGRNLRLGHIESLSSQRWPMEKSQREKGRRGGDSPALVREKAGEGLP